MRQTPRKSKITTALALNLVIMACGWVLVANGYLVASILTGTIFSQIALMLKLAGMFAVLFSVYRICRTIAGKQ